MPQAIRPVKPQPLTPKEEVASRISAGIFASLAHVLLDTEGEEVLHRVKAVSFRYADIFFATESGS